MEIIRLFASGNWPATLMSASQFFSNLPGVVLAVSFGEVMGLLRVLGATVAVSLLAYYVLKLMGGARARQFRRSGGNLQLLESVGIGVGTSLQLVKAADKFLVIAVSKERVSLLTELENIELDERAAQVESTVPFGSLLAKFMKPKDDNGAEEK